MELKEEKIISVLENSIQTLIAIKSDLIELKNYEKVAVFRDYEKQIEKQLDIIKGETNFPQEPLSIKAQKVETPNFSKETKRILKTINKENELIFTKDLTLKILNNPDSNLVSIFSKLGIERNEIINSLNNSFCKDDIVSRDHLLFTMKALKAIDTSFLEIKLTKENEVTPLTILLCVLRNVNDLTTKILHKHGMTYEKLLTEINNNHTHNTI